MPAKAAVKESEETVDAASADHLRRKLSTDPNAIREAVLGAFDSRMTPPAVPFSRKLFTLLVAGVLLVLPLFYVAAMVGLAYGLFWLATSGYGRSLNPAVFWTAQVVGVLLLVCLIKPLVEPRRRVVDVLPLASEKETLLIEFLTLIGKQVNAPPPKRVQLECSTCRRRRHDYRAVLA